MSSNLIERMLKLAGLENQQVNESVFGSMVSQLSAATKDDKKRNPEDGDEDTSTTKRTKRRKTPEEKSAESMGPKRRVGKPEHELTTQFREWIKNNPNATRQEAISKGESLGWKRTHANTMYYKHRAKSKAVSEFWIVVNPDNGKVLAEGSSGISPAWVDYDDPHTIDADIFTTETAAETISNKLFMMGSPNVIICSRFLQDDSTED